MIDFKPLKVGIKLGGNPLDTAESHTHSELSLDLGKDLPLIFDALKCEIKASLFEGLHVLALNERAIKLNVDKDTKLELDFDFLAKNERQLSIERGSINISPPLLIENVFTTLDELSVLIADVPSHFASLVPNKLLSKTSSFLEKTATPYLNSITDSKNWKRLKDSISRSGLEANIEKSKELLGKGLEKAELMFDNAIEGVSISQIVLGCSTKENEHFLHFTLSGEVLLSDRLRIPFNEVKLPETFVPKFDAHLRVLLSQIPLESDQGAELSRMLIGMLSTADGELSAKMSLMHSNFEIQTRVGREITVHIPMNKQLDGKLSFELGHVGEHVALEAKAELLHKEASILKVSSQFQSKADAAVLLIQALDKDLWHLALNGQGKDAQGRIVIERGARLSPELISWHARDARLKEEVKVTLELSPIDLDGTIDIGLEVATQTIYAHAFSIRAAGSAKFKADEPLYLDRTTTHFMPLKGDYKGEFIRKVNGQIRGVIDSDLDFLSKIFVDFESFPELGLPDKALWIDAQGSVKLQVKFFIDNPKNDIYVVAFDDSSFQAQINAMSVKWNHVALKIAEPLSFGIDLKHGAISSSGITESVLYIDWLFKKTPVFQLGELDAEVFYDEMLKGQIILNITERGHVNFEGGSGFFDAHFFNALIYPERERAKWLAILENEDLGDRIGAILHVTSVSVAPFIDTLRKRYLAWKPKADALGLTSLQKLMSIENIAKALALFFYDDVDMDVEFMPILEQIAQGKGILRYKAEELIERAFPDIEFDNLGRVLKWLDRSFTTIDGYVAPETTQALALCDDERYINDIAVLPTPVELYEGDWENGDLPARCMRYAAGLRIAQIEWVIAHRAKQLLAEDLDKLRKLVSIKKRIRMQQVSEGSFVIQDINIDFFLQDLLDSEEFYFKTQEADSSIADCFRSWLAPEDVARLVSAGISSRYHGQFVQVNQARLLEYLVRKGKHFALATFYEIGQNSTRVLAGMLLSFVEQDQNLLRNPVDRSEILGQLLDLPFPKRNDYAPGGAKAKDSYFEALYQVAERINDTSDAYCAAKLRLHSYRFDSPSAPSSSINPKAPTTAFHIPDFSKDKTERALAKTLKALDTSSKGFVKAMLGNKSVDPEQISDTRSAYMAFIAQMAERLEAMPESIESPTSKLIWQRVHEALIIQSIEDELLEDLGNIRSWFAHRTGIAVDTITTMTHAERIKKIVNCIYAVPLDRRQLLADPLIWLEIRAPEGDLDFTIITAMGIITDGKSGTELEESFNLLKAKRKLSIVRADTGNVKALDFNAAQVEAEIRKVKGPFALLGYSQGCVNMMRAESRLYGGTPDERASLEKLVARQFLYSALNGTPHAICGGEKYRRLLADGESLVKSMTAIYSSAIGRILSSLLTSILDAPLITGSLNSLESVSPIGLRHLARDAQFKPEIISFNIHGIIEKNIPQALKIMCTHFERQAKQPNDSQIGQLDARPYCVYNRNDSVDILRREAIPSRTLHAHHWFPLNHEVDFIKGDKDRANFAYDGPKNLHLSPWIDTLILFGKLRVSKASASKALL